MNKETKKNNWRKCQKADSHRSYLHHFQQFHWMVQFIYTKRNLKHCQVFVTPKGTSRQRSGIGAIRKRFPLQKPRWEKTKLTIRHLYHETYRKHIVSRMSSYFPNRWPPSYLNLIKNMKTHIRRQQHKKF